jgi:hypothetical protein
MECSESVRSKNNYIHRSRLNQFKNKFLGIISCFSDANNQALIYKSLLVITKFCVFFFSNGCKLVFSPLKKKKKNRDGIEIKKTLEKNLWIQLSKIGRLLNEKDLLCYKETK